MKRIVLTSFLSLFLLQCAGAGTLSESRLVGAGFGDGDSPQVLKEVLQLEPADIDTAEKLAEQIKTLKDSSKMPISGSFVILSFSQILDGDLIETIETNHSVGREAYKNKIPVVTGYKQVPGIVKIEASVDGTAWDMVDVNTYIVSYRAEGGFVPMPDVPVYLNPAPAIRIDLVAKKDWPKGFIKITLTDKFKNKDGTGVLAHLLLKTDS